MSAFSDRPFVAGSVFGLRAFNIDRLGRLTSPSFDRKPFTPGENVAECYVGDMTIGGNRLSGIFGQLSYFGSDVTYRIDPATSKVRVSRPRVSEAAVEKPKPEHVLAGVECKCGFYAYTDGSNDYRHNTNASAVIEGYGLVTVGSQGFRAEKAKLRALFLPTHDGDEDGDYGIQFATRNALVRRNYPDVPVFDTEALMVAEFPLTTDSLPTPDDDDFWTRGA